jgi:uroporphyrin-III C-methyltransferase / precorrin-2 dehydrogenase / sirohydrochlorin ferrochelatase
VLVGGGSVAAAKLHALAATGARVRVVAPVVGEEIERAGVEVVKRGFVPSDLDGAWLAIAAATPEVNRAVAQAAESRRIFVNAVDDPANATAFLTGTVRRGGVTVAISTSGAAPAMASLLREALDAVLPRDLAQWMETAGEQRKNWRRDAVPMPSRKPQLLQALNALYDTRPVPVGAPLPSALCPQPSAFHTSSAGRVSLVGAGPGDPGLLTRAAVARLRAADLVLYDALIDDRMLRVARTAQRFFAGKRAGRHAMTQETINTVMIRAARRGRRVVRLKGGDPFVFGRGGEEMLALEKAGVPWEVVPGVTSAFAAPALAGIPVTHRGVASAVLVVSGHDDQAFAAAIESIRPNDVTLVVLMGAGRARRVGDALQRRGWSADAPAAIVVDASAANQQVWRGTVGQLSAPELKGPATIIIGEVVALAGQSGSAASGLEGLYVTGT